MNAFLKNFNGANFIYKLTDNKDSIPALLDQDFNVLLYTPTNSHLYPENIDFSINEEEYAYLDALGNEACIEINPDGRIASAFGKLNDNTLYITDKCNSNCIMCPMAEPSRRDGHTVPFEIQKELIRYMPSEMDHLTITGGEPFYIKDKLFSLLAELKNSHKAFSYLLLSNGRVFSNRTYCELFSANVPEDFLVGIPLHGHTAALHDSISQSPGSFAQTTAGIKNLLATKATSVEIRIVVNKINASYLSEIATYIIDNFYGIDSVKIMGMEMLGNAIVNSDKVWIPYDEAFLFMKPAIDKLVQNSIDVEIYNFPLCFVERSYWNLCANSITEHKIKYSVECSMCSEKSACGGMFTGTDKFLSGKVKPIKS